MTKYIIHDFPSDWRASTFFSPLYAYHLAAQVSEFQGPITLHDGQLARLTGDIIIWLLCFPSNDKPKSLLCKKKNHKCMLSFWKVSGLVRWTILHRSLTKMFNLLYLASLLYGTY